MCPLLVIYYWVGPTAAGILNSVESNPVWEFVKFEIFEGFYNVSKVQLF